MRNTHVILIFWFPYFLLNFSLSYFFPSLLVSLIKLKCLGISFFFLCFLSNIKAISMQVKYLLIQKKGSHFSSQFHAATDWRHKLDLASWSVTDNKSLRPQLPRFCLALTHIISLFVGVAPGTERQTKTVWNERFKQNASRKFKFVYNFWRVNWVSGDRQVMLLLRLDRVTS